jgi:hypothetical protein
VRQIAPLRHWPFGWSSTSPAGAGTIQDVELIVGATVWGLFSCFLLFPHLGMPALFQRAATCLLVAEFVLAMAWKYGSEGCVQRPCGAGAETARTAVSLDIPVLSIGLVALAVVHGVRVHRRKARV